MTMEILLKLKAISEEILHERPDLLLFAAVIPYGPAGRWQLVVSAPWVARNLSASTDYVMSHLKSRLTSDETKQIFSLTMLPPENDDVYDIASHVAPWKDGIGYLASNCMIRERSIRRGYIFVANIELLLENELR